MALVEAEPAVTLNPPARNRAIASRRRIGRWPLAAMAGLVAIAAGVLLGSQLVGAGAEVAPNSVVMKRELLLPGRRYAGCPVRPAREPASP